MLGYILALGAVLRLIAINQSFWLDEATTASVVKNFNLSQIVSQFTPGDFHPPLYYLVLKLYSNMFGSSDFSLRSFSVICGLLTIVLIYKITLKISKKSEAAIFAAALLATSPLAIYYSQEARMYSFTTMLVALAVFFFFKVLKKKNNPLSWAGFALASFCAFASFYPSLVIIPVFIFFAYKQKLPKRWWTKFFLVQSFYLPPVIAYWPILAEQLSTGSGVGVAWGQALGGLTFKNLALVVVKFLIGRISFYNKFTYGIFVLVGFGLYAIALKNSKKYSFFWIWFFVPVILISIVSIYLPMLSYFRLLFILPSVYILTALGAQKLKNVYFLPVILGIFSFNLIAAMIYLGTPRFHREDWKMAVEQIKLQSENHSYRVIFPAKSQMEALDHYWPEANRAGGPGGVDGSEEQIYYIRYAFEITDPQELAKNKIEGLGYTKSDEFDFNGVNILKYTRI